MTAHYKELNVLLFSNKRFLAIAILYFVGISLVFTQITHALFTDSASSNSNTFTAAAEFPSGPPLTSAELKINEVFQAGSALDEWIEIYNPTTSSVDISGWSISDNTATDVLPSVSPVLPNGYALIKPNGGSATASGSTILVQLSDTQIGGSLAQGGDEITLRNTGSLEIDKMSYGSNLSADFPTPLPTPPAGSSFSRIPNGTDTNSNTDWQLDSSPTIGTVNSL